MTDDFVSDGILPDDLTSGDGEFDPNEFESDDILDDVDGEVKISPKAVVGGEFDDEDEDLMDE